ncbi:hypothetical protein F4824DRAFT_510877 [Ustulina deusta]|nr:hypothetical protein F4824DRAFT_510877 [Ustulina deusta]
MRRGVTMDSLHGLQTADKPKGQRIIGLLTLNPINSMLTTVTGSSMAAIVGSAQSQNPWNGFGQLRRSSGLTTRPAQDLQVYEEASRGPMGGLALP